MYVLCGVGSFWPLQKGWLVGGVAGVEAWLALLCICIVIMARTSMRAWVTYTME